MKIGTLVLAVLGLAATMAAAPIAAVGVAVWPNERFSNELPSRAIDGDTSTFTWSTESFTTAENSLGLDFGGLFSLGHISLWKSPDGGGGLNIKNLIIEYTADSSVLALSARTWTPVTGLINGFNGSELMTATSVNSDGTVIGDVHDSSVSGWASLSFNLVDATGVRIRFDNPVPSYNHYRVAEFQAFSDTTATPEPATFWLVAVSGGSLAWIRSKRKVTNAQVDRTVS